MADADAADDDIHPALEISVDGLLVVLGDDFGDIDGFLHLFDGFGIQRFHAFQGEAARSLFFDELHALLMAHSRSPY